MTLDPLIVDTAYPPAPSCWARLVAAGAPWHGAILKASHGTRPWSSLNQHWPEARSAGHTKRRPHERYGDDWFRGAYHYLLAGHDGAAQADAYLGAIERAGGWGVGDLWPIVDVEEGDGNAELVAARPDGVAMLAGTVEAFVARVKQRTGREVVLYAGGWLRSLGLRDRFGCSRLWLAAYVARLPAEEWAGQLGFGLDELLMWQYAGAAGGRVFSELAGYPRTTPIGDADISALTLSGGVERLRSTLWAERPG